MAVIAERQATATTTESAGAGGAVVVLIDAEFEPDGSDSGPGLRVVVNDHPTCTGVELQAPED